ncbi:SirA family protein [candidate division MSBL1 archaeon SCGC-AAA382C18]|uniref:SirA family protein n=1 Tax=candidate division MSBL1 archaeon SCGC-AAA382C18 TaxID=1698281 RepID=A0A133VJV7_9EURY|nr:SirA family protein [candidate division MSBL1 archaeon SCGC-AAA382C18]
MGEEKTTTIEVTGETCPVPLVQTRKAIRKASPGEIIEVTGDHEPSKKEIPMAMEEMGLELLEVEDTEEGWRIKIRNSEEGG